ncbi:lipopolysaccharide biosynthesis protein [Shewanella xiamenensis]|uniref:lipopolysaccharide biosynthesis protein n=1 Tax=Shewanella xiamenensis TaxID=332186 RepID=UPI0035BA008B
MKATAYLTTDVLVNIVAFCNILLLTNNLSLKSFGVFAIIQGIVLLIETATSSQSWQAFVKYGSRYSNRDDGLKVTILLARTLQLEVIGQLFGTIITAFAVYIYCLYNDLSQYSGAFVLCSIFMVNRFLNVTTGIFRLLRYYQYINLRFLIVSIFRLIFLLYLFFLDELTLQNALYLYALTELVGTVFIIMVSKGVYKRNYSKFGGEVLLSRLNRIRYKTAFYRYVFYTYWAQIFSTVSKQTDILIVGFVSSNETAGLYKIIKQIARIGSMLSNPIMVMLFPEFSRKVSNHGVRDLIKIILKVRIYVFSLMLVFYGVFYLLNEKILLLFGDEYLAGKNGLSIFMLAVAISLSGAFYHPFLMAIGKVKSIAFINTVNSVIFTSLTFILTYLYQVEGAVTAYLIYVLIDIGSRFMMFELERKKLGEN